MKKFAITLITVILISVATSSLFAASVGDTAVIRLTAYIPEKSTFNMYDDQFVIQSNANNFTYSIQEFSNTRMLSVVAK